MKSPLRLAYWILSVLGILAFLLLFRKGAEWRWEDFGLNLLTEVVGIAVTLFFIEQAFRAQEEARDRKYTQVVHRRLRAPLSHHVGLWHMIVKSAYNNALKAAPELAKQAVPPTLTLDELITTGQYDILKVFDPRVDAAVYPPMPWSQYLTHELNQFKTQLMQIVDAYAVFLTPEELEKVEACLNSNLMIALPQMIHLPNPPGGKPLHPFHAIEEGVKRVPTFVGEHLKRVREIVLLLNESLPPADRIVLDRAVAPKADR